MARGKPDYHRATVIEAKHGSDFIPVVVDASGQMYIALTGQNIGVSNLPSDYLKEDGDIANITNNVTVDQQDSDRVLKGTEGANKRYVAVDSTGVLLARLKGAFGATLKDISVDTNGILLARLKGAYSGILKDIAVDTDGKIVAVLQGDDDGTLRTIFVDSSGKMVTRIQGIGAGEKPVFTIDDGGDENLISEWVGSHDGLDPVDVEDFGKEGQHSMKLRVDASKSEYDFATWSKTDSIGDIYQYKELKIKMWIYFSSIDYLDASGVALQYIIGSSAGDYYSYNLTKANLEQGWNLLEFDLNDPDLIEGTIDFTDLDYQRIYIGCLIDNTNDFYAVLDLIVIIEENENEGSMLDVAVDKDGLMLNKLVGSYGELHKPIAADRFGNMRVNISEQGEFTQVSNPYRGLLQTSNIARNHPDAETYPLVEVTGRGVIMGGYIRHNGDCTHKMCSPSLYLDGKYISLFCFMFMNDFNLVEPWNHIPHLIKYDDDNYEYICAFPHPIIFNTSFTLYMQETIGATSSTHAGIIYSLF